MDSLDLETDIVAGGTDDDEQAIDWGDIAVEENVNEGGIDWGAVDDMATEIVIEDSGTAAGVASGSEGINTKCRFTYYMSLSYIPK